MLFKEKSAFDTLTSLPALFCKAAPFNFAFFPEAESDILQGNHVCIRPPEPVTYGPRYSAQNHQLRVTTITGFVHNEAYSVPNSEGSLGNSCSQVAPPMNSLASLGNGNLSSRPDTPGGVGSCLHGMPPFGTDCPCMQQRTWRIKCLQ